MHNNLVISTLRLDYFMNFNNNFAITLYNTVGVQNLKAFQIQQTVLSSVAADNHLYCMYHISYIDLY